MNPADCAHQRFIVLGAARSGLAAAQLLRRAGAQVFVSESSGRETKAREADLLDETRIPSEFGGHSDRVFQGDAWVVSPGIPISSPWIQKALDRGIPVFGELETASWFCRAPMVAVTGSNGKSTTTALLGDLFKASGRPCVVAGNIGDPFSKFADTLAPEGVAVLEVSSFQLETTRDFHPRVAVYLNLTPDHLNRHGTLEEYGRLKARIFENQGADDVVVYNVQDILVADSVRTARSRKLAFGVKDDPSLAGWVGEDRLMIRIGEKIETLLPKQDVGIQGEHNMSNVLAAALAAHVLDLPIPTIRSVLRRFHGLPHRMEAVRTIDGVLWVNDSKATNTDSVWYALGSYSGPIVWIAGGRDKESDFTVLADRVREKTKAIILIGEAASKMEKAFARLKPISHAGSLEEAVTQARHLARSGDVVLLSPACASFDMFRDFEDRGERFRTLVEKLP
jgi:UDP-N-acetylmuramoylalanine--D-glutamate ligase